MGFTLHRGEVLGLAGLVGAGRSELVMSLFNCWGKKLRGKVVLLGRTLEINSPQDAIGAGICLASEDRKRYGLIISSDVRTNTTLAALDKVSRHGLIDFDEEIGQAEKYVRELTIKTPSIEQTVGNLSGGNQQKVVLAKCLMTGPSAVILDEPTRGVDVGAKYEIYTIINALAGQGVGVLVISSDLPELLGICDRILVMHEGRFTGDVPIQDATQENIMACAVGMNL
jgi:D-xylose transport system ATP-binding protein